MTRLFVFFLCVFCVLAPAVAFATGSPDDASAAQQVLEDQAAQIAAGERITRAAFGSTVAYTTPAEEIGLLIRLENLTPGKTYTASAMLKDGRSGYASGGRQNPQAERAFTPDSSVYDCPLLFTLDTRKYPDARWTAAAVLSDETGAVLDSYNGNMEPISVVSPLITSDITQGDVDGTLVISFVTEIASLKPDDPYTLTATLSEEDSRGPYEAAGQKLTGTAPIVLTRKDQQRGMRSAFAEVVIKTPMEAVRERTLVPTLTLLSGDAVIARQEGTPIAFGALSYSQPTTGADTEETSDEENAPETSHIETACVENPDAAGMNALAQATEDRESPGPEPGGPRNPRSGQSLAIAAAAGVAAGIFIWTRRRNARRREQRGW